MTTSTMSSGVSSGPPTTPAAPSAVDHPGRWIGGAIGVGVSLLAAIVGTQVGDRLGSVRLEWGQLGLYGVPIAFALGRELFPLARSAGWRRALSVGLVLALLAPPLGAVELLAASIVWPATSGSVSGLWVVVLLPYALVFSFVALIMTVPAGVAWAIVVRAVPDGALDALRMPAPFDRLGLRHALLAAVVVIVLLELALRRGAP